VKTLTTTSRIAAPADAVWTRVTTPEGINDELRPVMKMTVPAAFRGKTIADVLPGTRLGRSYFLVLGFLPIDYDDITVAEVDAGRRFLESSTMMSMRSWRHERTLTPVGSEVEVRDVVSFQVRFPFSRVPGWSSVLAAGLGALFRHRHRRLAAFFTAN
jgi:ligand-binding SRPBCC domain-containing protein